MELQDVFDAQGEVVRILKERFNNLTAEEVAILSSRIVMAVVTKLDKK